MLGRQFADQLSAGSVVGLIGELGAGKTQFTRGIVSAVGSSAGVTSPTFTIVHEYTDGRLPVYHFDFFRLDDRERLTQLGLDDYFFGDGISVVEWADRFVDVMPEPTRWIRFEVQPDDRRVIHIQ
jgi:tRNA threonylcarbamoyladenosine biosynthesis protein TsaE